MPTVEDLTGKMFGKWTVLYRVDNDSSGGTMWMCLCSCGTSHIREVKANSLRNGRSSSCGCIQKLGESPGFVDLSGMLFGRWTVVDRAKNNGSGCAVWNCLCSCSPDIVNQVSANQLRSGRSKSCGCLHGEISSRIHTGNKYNVGRYSAAPGASGRKRVLDGYKRSASNRALTWDLTDEDFFRITGMNCQYCGLAPSNQSRLKEGMSSVAEARSSYIYSGIDRVNNDIGYVASNCVPCCKVCNLSKRNLSPEDWLSYLDRVVAFRTNVTRPKPRKTKIRNDGQMNLLDSLCAAP